jgi:chemotaxis protein methyltransferase CheR
VPDEGDVEAIEVRLFLEAIAAKYGFDLRGYSPASIRRRVLASLARTGLPHLGELQHRVLTDPAFFASVLDDLTVRVSEMFRAPAFYRTFRERVVPLLQTYPLVRVWHSGCASGEEVYTTAILLHEAGLYERAQIYATDISPRALEEAKAGVYALDRLPHFAKNYRDASGTGELSTYLTTAYDRVAIKEHLRPNIFFFQHDLVSDHVFGEMHVVFCRNVLIYFGKDLRRRVLRKLAGSLRGGGFLCVGEAERLTADDMMDTLAELAPEVGIYRATGAGL